MEKIWQLPAEESFTDSDLDLSPILKRLYYNRGVKNESDRQAFLHTVFGDEKYFKDFDPFLFADMEKAVDLIISKIKSGAKIVIFGDYDADGVTSSALMLQALDLLKAKTDVYIPDRVKEGYGLNEEAVRRLAAEGAELIITVDCGIRSNKEAALAKELGVDLIISDHHSLPNDRADLPPCLVLDCADPESIYPNRYLAGVGMAFKIIQGLLIKSSLDNDTRLRIMSEVLDLVALGTVTDMVPLLGENRLLVKAGLEVLNKQKRLGVSELAIAGKINSPFTAFSIGFQFGPRLNAASRLAHANTALSLLMASDKQEAKDLALDLQAKNIERQRQTEKVVREVEAQIDENNLSWILVGLAELNEDSWNEGVIGLAAGRLAEKYHRPTLVITRTSEGFKSSGRSIPGFNMVKALEECASDLDRYGGHPMACGFSIFSQDKLDNFLKKIEEIAKRELEGKDLRPTLDIEALLPVDEINLEMFKSIEDLGPFGQVNSQPRLAALSERVYDIIKMGSDKQHIKLKLAKGIYAIAFAKAEEYSWIKAGDNVDIVYYLETNDWNGNSSPQLKIIDIRASQNI